MLYRNVEIHNIAEIIKESENNSIKWLRVPKEVYERMETEQGKRMCTCSTGVELRFVMKSDTVTIRMRTTCGAGVFHVFRGSVQGGWEDHEVNKIVHGEFSDYIIKKSENSDMLNRIKKDFEQPFAPEVIRVIFDRGYYELLDIIGDVVVPEKNQLPQMTLFAYGSSITHGSNSIDISHSWVSLLAHNLKMDCINLGMAGSCLMEPKIVEYIADEGEKNRWDVAVLELGINALNWENEKIIERVGNTLRQIAGRNQDKPIFIISPFYSDDDYNKNGNAEKWRRLIEDVVNQLDYNNVTYINGLDLLGDMSLISADQVHPNIYGIAQIAERITKIMKSGQYDNK